MKKSLLSLPVLFLLFGISYGYQYMNPGGLSGGCIPVLTGAKGPSKYKIASNSMTTIAAVVRQVPVVCPGDYEYDYYKTNREIINNGINEIMNTDPLGIDNYDCSQFSDSFSKEMCEEEVKNQRSTDAYIRAVTKKETEEKQAEIEAKQKELEEKQAEIEAKQKEIEEEQERIKQQQERNEKIEESTYQIVEELTKENTVERVMSEEVKKAKEGLGVKAAIFDSLVPLFKKKDQKTQNNVKALLKTFTQSNDEYTRNIGIYFGYLVE